MNTQWKKLFGYFVVISVLTMGVTLLPSVGAGAWMPASISREAGDIDKLFWGMTILSVVILGFVMAIVVYSVLHFRAHPGDDGDGDPIHGHAKMELVWVIVPAIIVTIISVLSYVILLDEEKTAPKGVGMTVQVRGFQFGWDFTYPLQQVSQASNLVLPLGKVVRFDVLSCSGRESRGFCARRYGKPVSKVTESGGRDDNVGDVLHAFWVPEARLKTDAVPNIPTRTQWTPNKLTRPVDAYQVVCAELCGAGHNAMRADACVLRQGAFDWWTEHTNATCVQLRYFNCVDDTAYDDLLARIDKLVTEDPEATCKDLEEAA